MLTRIIYWYIVINKNILVYMRNYTFSESCIPHFLPDKFRTPQKIAQQFSHPVFPWMNY